MLNGVVDRLPLPCTRLAVGRSAGSSGAGRADRRGGERSRGGRGPSGTVAQDLLAPRPLHAQTWELLLARAGFVSVAPLEAGAP